MHSRGRLPESVAGWAATDQIELMVPAVVTGVSVFHDEHVHRYLDAPGYWGGGTTRDNEIPLGRFVSSSVMRGMSGAPVRRLSDDVVIGVVSQRYNAADGWGRDSVWTARIEDLRSLLGEPSEIAVVRPPSPTSAADVVLTVTDDRVRLRSNGTDVSAAHTGVRPGLLNAIADVRSERTRLRSSAITRGEFANATSRTGAHSASLRRAGELIAHSFLPAPVAAALTRIVTDAVAAHVPVKFGIDTGPFPELPWEALPDPVTGQSLALHPLITVYRRLPAPPARSIPAPIRILVAIAAPDNDGGPLLDYERELRNVMSAVRGARHRDAEVRIVEFATTAAIRAELAQAPAHVLHLSGHAKPGYLLLEDENGAVREVDAETLVAEAIPPGSMPPVISLAACDTDVAAETATPSFATALVARGASVVIGTETSVTDRYATALFARVYHELTLKQIPNVVAAVADARRVIHQQWSTSTDPAEVALAKMDEWSAVTVLGGAGDTGLHVPAVSEAVARHATIAVPGLSTRPVGEFVGRRREQRRLPTYLTGTRYPGIVLHGLGGVGKTALAAQIVYRQRSTRVIPVVTGHINVDSLLSAVAGTVRRHCLIDDDASRGPHVLRAAEIASDATESWQNRFTALRTFVLDRVPVLVVLDNFEDNLTDVRSMADPTLAALLSTWLADPGCSRLLVTSRHPFVLPDNAHHRLLMHQVGPLSRAETSKLIWSLPALDRLSFHELNHIWRLVGGHPRSLEYLDALLNNRVGRHHDITHRLENAIAGNPDARPALTALDLDTALATTVTLIADDILLDQLLSRLTPAAHQLLIGASVYREAVEGNALLYQIGTDNPSAARQPDYRALEAKIAAIAGRHGLDPALTVDLASIPQHVLDQIEPAFTEYNTEPCPPISTDADIGKLTEELARNSLLTIDPDTGRAFVHRSTASALERSLAQHQRDDILAIAHRRAATYWVWRVAAWPQGRDEDLHDRLEARYHYRQAANTTAAHDLTLAICDRLHTVGAWDHETTLVHDTLRLLPSDAPERAHWLLRLGVVSQLRGDHAEAEQQYLRALTISEELGNRAGMATSYHQLGVINQLRGDYTEAEQQYLRALTISEELGNRAGMATSYHQLGVINQLQGDYTEAEQQYQSALTIKLELGNREGTAISYGQLGALAQDRGDHREAEQQYQRALTINRELDSRAGTAINYSQLGALAQDRGDYAEAEQQYQHALTINQELGNRAGTAGNFHQLGALAQLRGDYTEAEHRYRRALTINEELGNRVGSGGNHHQLGTLAQLRGDYTEAEHRYLRALTAAEELGYRAGIATTISSLGSLKIERNQLIEAVEPHIQAWLLRTEMKLGAAAGHNLGALRELRDRIGPRSFHARIRQVLDTTQAVALEDLLDRQQ
nr:tetratricopeptide repeat protein [Nocardia bovistercoris]